LIDVFSRKANCRYLKNKTADLTAQALKEMIDDMGKPVQISGDKGREWAGAFKKYCVENDIKLTLKDKDGKFSNGIIERFNKTLIGYVTLYKSQFPRKGILQIAAELPEFIKNYNGREHRSIGLTPDEAWETNMIAKNRTNLNETGRMRTRFKVGDLVRVKKERDIFTKQRVEAYSREIFTIIKKDGNMYTLSGEYEGRDVYSYNSLLKVEVKEDELEKRLVKEKVPLVKEDVEEDTKEAPTVAVKKVKASLPAPILRTSSRLARINNNRSRTGKSVDSTPAKSLSLATAVRVTSPRMPQWE
jgi:hypothetical protein